METITIREMTIQFEIDWDERVAMLHHAWIEDEETDSVKDVLPNMRGAHEASLSREVFARWEMHELDR